MTEKAIIVKDENQLDDNHLYELLDAPMFRDIEKRVNHSILGETIKTPIESRLKNSKFAQLIDEMPFDELKVLALVMGFSPKGMKAIKMYLNAENSRIQVYALKKKLQEASSGVKMTKSVLKCPFCGNTELFKCTKCEKEIASHFTTPVKYTYALLPIITARPKITIDESARQDFMNMMGWSEEEFERHTIKVII